MQPEHLPPRPRRRSARARRAPRGCAPPPPRSSRARCPRRGRCSRSRSGSPVPSTGPRWSSWSRGSSRSTRRTGRASAAPGSARRWRSTRSCVVPDPALSIGEGAIVPWANSASNYYEQVTEAIAERYGVDLETPWQELPGGARPVPVRDRRRALEISYRNRYGRRRSYATRFEGIVPNLAAPLPRDRLRVLAREDRGVHVAAACPACDGARLRAGVARGARRGDARSRSSRALSARRALEWLEEVELSETDRHVARLILREISERLRFLENVGIGYLSMDRAAATLSGGEAQRIRLATQIGSSLVGRAVHPRRAVDRAAPARQREADRDARAPARPRQHGDRRRARRADDARRRPPRRPGSGCGRARRARSSRRGPPTRSSGSRSR